MWTFKATFDRWAAPGTHEAHLKKWLTLYLVPLVLIFVKAASRNAGSTNVGAYVVPPVGRPCRPVLLAGQDWFV